MYHKWPTHSYSKLMYFVSVGLVVGLIVLVALLCLLVLYFRKPANCKHFRSRVTSLFSVRHSGQFYYSRVSTHFQVRQDIISVHYWHLFHVLILGLAPHCEYCHIVILMLPNYSISCIRSFLTDQWWTTLIKVKSFKENVKMRLSFLIHCCILIWSNYFIMFQSHITYVYNQGILGMQVF